MPKKLRRHSSQYAIDWLREVVISRNGAISGLYSGFVALARASIAPLIEAETPVPVMFCCKAALESWASLNKMKCSQVGTISTDDAVKLFPQGDPGKVLQPSVMYWVRAKSSCYRSALIEWFKADSGADCVRKANTESLTFLKAAKKDISKIPTTHRRFSRERKNLALAQVSRSIKEFTESMKREKPDESVAFKLMGTLDADHVANRASLSQLPDAWVLVFPVPSDANRGFGRSVERSRVKVAAATLRIDLTPETAFKLFASAMPNTESELETVMGAIKKQIKHGAFLDEMKAAISKRLSENPASKRQTCASRKTGASVF